jgi:predicted RecA/RadA family phage recombinase
VADYVPLFKPGQAYTSTVATTAVVGGRLVEVNGAGTVGPAGAASVKVVGVAAFDAAVGEKVTLHRGGVQRLTASAAIAAGDNLAAAATGKVAAIGAGTFGQLVGVALTAAAADGDLVDVLMVR